MGRHLYRGSNFARKSISTTPIGAPMYIFGPGRQYPLAPLLVISVDKKRQSETCWLEEKQTTIVVISLVPPSYFLL